MLEIIAGSVLIAFGILAIYFSSEQDTDQNTMIVILAGILAIALGGWLLVQALTWGVILKKIAGLLLTGFGLFLVIGFPDVPDYQRQGMSVLGVFLGLIILVAGVYLVLF